MCFFWAVILPFSVGSHFGQCSSYSPSADLFPASTVDNIVIDGLPAKMRLCDGIWFLLCPFFCRSQICLLYKFLMLLLMLWSSHRLFIRTNVIIRRNSAPVGPIFCRSQIFLLWKFLTMLWMFWLCFRKNATMRRYFAPVCPLFRIQELFSSFDLKWVGQTSSKS